MSIASETLDLLKAAQATPIAKAGFRTDQPSDAPNLGPKFYNLDAVVQQMYPVVVPLLKLIPRVKSAGGNAYNFKQITAVNPSRVFSGGQEGKRGGVIDHTFRDVTVKFVTSILENSVTWQSELASQGLTPQNRALSAQTLINSFLLDEHKNIIGANASLALGTTGTPVLDAVTDAASTLPADDYVVIAVALTPEGWDGSSLANGVQLDYTATNAVGGTFTVPGGHAAPSATSAAVTVASGEAIDAVVPHTAGAAGYAWFVGDAAGTARLVSLTRGNTTTIRAMNGAGQLASAVPASDKSRNPYRFDGLLTQIQTPGSGSVVKNLGGEALTTNGSGGVVEIDEVLQEAWDSYKISYTHLFVSATLRRKINAAILGAPAGSGAARLVLKGDNAGVTTGTFVTEYVNPVTGRSLELVTLPDLPDNQVLFYSTGVDYAVPDTANIIEMILNSDYYQIEWPMIALSYDIAVATYGALAVRFPPAFGLLVNVG